MNVSAVGAQVLAYVESQVIWVAHAGRGDQANITILSASRNHHPTLHIFYLLMHIFPP